MDNELNFRQYDIESGAAPSPLLSFYFAIWAFVMPISTFLIFPDIQGTTPATILSGFAVFALCGRKRFWITLIICSLLWAAFYFTSRAAIMSHAGILLDDLRAIESSEQSLVFRMSTFTQTAYLIPCLLVFMFTREFYHPNWMKYIMAGGWLLALFGLAEWFYYLVSHDTFTLFVNRSFESNGNEIRGSAIQVVNVGPATVLRLKSFTSEPGFYAATVLPYLALAISTNRWPLTFILTMSLALAFSTTAYAGFLIVVSGVLFFRGRLTLFDLAFILCSLAACVFVCIAYPEILRDIFYEKFMGNNVSGEIRLSYTGYAYSYFMQLPWMCQLFGIGFGTTYLPVFLRVLLDVGVVGLLLFSFFMIRPITKLGSTPVDNGLKVGLLATLTFFVLSYPEVFTPTTWMFIGVAYWRSDYYRFSQV